jgi:hypothetical protein
VPHVQSRTLTDLRASKFPHFALAKLLERFETFT